MRIIVLVLVLLLLVPSCLAQQLHAGGLPGPTKGQVAAVIVGMAAIATGLVFVVYRTTHRHASLTGCLTTQPSGVGLQTNRDHRIVPLTGNIGDLKAGEQVKLQGKDKKDGFQVQKLAKHLGACQL